MTASTGSMVEALKNLDDALERLVDRGIVTREAMDAADKFAADLSERLQRDAALAPDGAGEG
jgi:hypothetical protein